MAKTAMQELLHRLEIIAKERPSSIGVAIARDIAEELIKKERKQLIEAFDWWIKNGGTFCDGKWYYNYKYKNHVRKKKKCNPEKA